MSLSVGSHLCGEVLAVTAAVFEPPVQQQVLRLSDFSSESVAVA